MRTAPSQARRSPAPASAVGVPRAATARRAPAPGTSEEYHGSLEELAPEAVGAGDGQIVASHLGSNPPDIIAAAVDPDEVQASPKPRVYRVDVEKHVSQNGQRFTLRVGKELDENNYDIPSLVKQGAKLTEITQEG